MKNEMIIAALETPEQKELYHAFAKEAECHFQEHKALNFSNKLFSQFANYAEITPMFQKNILKHYHALPHAFIPVKRSQSWLQW